MKEVPNDDELDVARWRSQFLFTFICMYNKERKARTGKPGQDR
jgi:hypothetical protein